MDHIALHRDQQQISSTEFMSDLQFRNALVNFNIGLGVHDVAQKIFYNHNIYGRENEIEQLDALYKRVTSGTVRASLACITGPSGCGKGSLVRIFGETRVFSTGGRISKFWLI